MSNLPNPLPPDVTDAIAKGHKVEAIRLLRERTGVSLVVAKQAVESHGVKPANELSFSTLTLPTNVLAELARGNKIEAIKLLREQTGLGLKEAKDAVDAAEVGQPGRNPGNLAPGEVPRSTGTKLWRWLLVAAALAGAYGYFKAWSPH
jgi:ribosomal protein L7/L12